MCGFRGVILQQPFAGGRELQAAPVQQQGVSTEYHTPERTIKFEVCYGNHG